MFDFVGDFLRSISNAVVRALNYLIEEFASILQALFDALPDLPDLPDRPDAMITAQEWVAWVFPVDTLVDILAFVAAMWLLWQGVVVVLNWAKARS